MEEEQDVFLEDILDCLPGLERKELSTFLRLIELLDRFDQQNPEWELGSWMENTEDILNRYYFKKPVEQLGKEEIGQFTDQESMQLLTGLIKKESVTDSENFNRLIHYEIMANLIDQIRKETLRVCLPLRKRNAKKLFEEVENGQTVGYWDDGTVRINDRIISSWDLAWTSDLTDIRD